MTTPAENPSYRVYTKKFDRVVKATDLASVLGPLAPADRSRLDEAWNELQNGLLPWKTKLQIRAIELSDRLRSKIPVPERTDSVVTLLFDQSGSMRGQKMLFSTASADIVQEFLGTLGIACEILGFTTAEWRGGRSRRRWNWRLRPRNPGRLNDLLHVIFREAEDNRVSTGGWALRQMLRPDYPKENIDGEAIEWAVSRLDANDRGRKYLVVLSDGAPVDDSTLNENCPAYLSNHLRAVVERVKNEACIKIAAFGIGFGTHDFYPHRGHVDEPSQLGIELLQFVTSLLLGEESSRSTEAVPVEF